MKVLLNSFHLNGRTLEFYTVVVDSRLNSRGDRVKILIKVTGIQLLPPLTAAPWSFVD